MKVMIWRNNAWVDSGLDVLPPHDEGKPEDCDHCNALLYWDLEIAAEAARKAKP